MAAGNSNYNRGDMEVGAQEGTFKGFMGGTVYGGASIALIVIMPTLVFGVGLGWPAALLVTFILGIVLGLALKLKAAWYAGLVVMSVVVAIFCVALSLLAG